MQAEVDQLLREKSFFLVPEFKMPAKKEAKTAVAGESPRDPEWIWSEGSEETMHPFWVVRRMTEKQLARERYEARPGQLLPRFNCELQVFSLSSVNIAVVGEKMLNRTRRIDVPWMTNSLPLEEGEELILEVGEKMTQAKHVKRSWRDAVKDNEKAKKKKKGQIRLFDFFRFF